MSWLGDSLNSITGQISSFTREVLNEGTEERSDHAAELTVFKDQVHDLNSQCQALRQEVERLRNANVELEEKAQSSELQIYSISSEYRSLLQQKEEELNHWKHQLPSHGQIDSGHAQSSDETHVFNYNDQSGVVDFDDVIDQHNEINRLTDENHRLRPACSSLVSPITSDSSAEYQGVESQHELQERIKELESQLHFEVDQHQDELTALQDFHQQKYTKLKDQYENEVSELQLKLSVIQDKPDDSEHGNNGEIILEYESEIKHLKAEATSSSDERNKQLKQIQLLERQLDQIKNEKSELQVELEAVHSKLLQTEPAESCSTQTEVVADDNKDHIPDETINNYELKISGFEALNNDLKLELDRSEEQHQLSIEALQQEQETTANLNNELSKLKEENSSLVRNLEKLDSQHEDALNHLLESKKLLEDQRSELTAKLQDAETRLNDEISSRPNHQDIFLDILRSKIQQNADIFNLSDQNIDLSFDYVICALEKSKEREQEIEDRVTFASNEIDQLKESNLLLEEKLEDQAKKYEADFQALKSKYEADDVFKSHISNGSSGGSEFEIVAKDDGSDQSSSSKEFVQIENKEVDEVSNDLVLVKDKEIKILQEKVLVMSQQLLDCQAPNADDSPASASVSILEDELKQVKFEKEQMMDVMNEKMRECSALKSEVHQLMNVVSAEKQALEKVQGENTRLANRHRDDDDEVNLTKETIQNLSRLVRDKDNELQALTEKNKSLLDALQNQSSSACSLENLIQEKESLQKQLNAYKSDREQIIRALNQKHQESMKFHSELQKVQNILSEENQKYDNLQLQHNSVAEQFEAKQKSLVNTQNDLLVLKQKFVTLETEQAELKMQYSLLIHKENSENFIKVEKNQWSNRNEECNRLKKSVEDFDRLVSEKDMLILEKAKKIKESEELYEKKSDEVKRLDCHIESLNIQLKTLREEMDELANQNTRFNSIIEDLRSESLMLKDVNNKLTSAVKEKDFELQNLASKVANSSDSEQANEEINKMMADYQALQQEKDQALKAMHHSQQQNKQFQNEISMCGDKEVRLMKELDRLRAHLVKVEESYTNEAIHAEEREKELRNRLALAEERIESSTCSYNSANQQAALQVDSLQEQLQMLASQRDDAILQLSNAQTQLQQYSSSLTNLQLVLEQFQQEKTRDINNVKKKLNMQIEEECIRTQEMAKEVDIHKKKLNETMEALTAASRISEQLDRKEQIISALKVELKQREQQLQTCFSEMQNFTSTVGGKVDKQVMKSLVLGYFSTPNDKKPEVVRLLASVLDFNQEEVEKVNLTSGIHGKKPGWLSWLSKPEAASPQSAPAPTPGSNSFSEAFVQFLQKESQPQIQVKLPAAEMAKELTMKTKQTPTKEPTHLKPLRINPFTASVSGAQQSPTQKTAATSSHLLMKPITSSLPTFTPLPVADTSRTSSNILKDVLKDD